MSFKAENKPFNNLLKNNILEIPRNQRKYVWKEENWEDLLSDIYFIVNEGQKKHHFIGSIVLKQEEAINGLDRFTIIDGQQRTITIILFLGAILKLFQEKGMKEDFEGTTQYLITKDRKGLENCILSSENYIFIDKLLENLCNYNNTKSLEDIIRLITIDKNKDKNIANCINFFYTSIKEKISEEDDSCKYLESIRDSILDTNYVGIIADTEEDSYTIFEILNARGQSLADHEILKNYIMRYIYPKYNVDHVKEQWNTIENNLGTSIKHFFKHYTTHKAQIKQFNKKEPIYRILQRIYPKDRVQDFINDLVLKSRYYQILLSPIYEGEEANCSKVEYRIFKFFKDKKAIQFRPILLSLINKKESGILSKELYERAIYFLYKFFICYNIIGEEKSNKLEDVIYKYAYKLESEYSDDKLLEFIDNLKNKIPAFSTFKEKFKVIGWSNHCELYKESKCKGRVKIVLELIESNLSKNCTFDDVTLEHILPDSKDEKNSLIGNILLLEDSINKNCKDKELNEKIILYKGSNFKMARNFANIYENKEFDSSTRAELLAKKIYYDILKLDSDK